MKQMTCSICSYVYDQTKGIPEADISANTKWEDLPSDWKCPWCSAGKDAFYEKKDKIVENNIKKPHIDKEFTAIEMSIICSNLAKGCEKQYLYEQAKLFSELADFFKSKVETVDAGNSRRLSELIDKDLAINYPYANTAASKKPDRGALRALTWSEKVTRMLQSLLSRYEKEGEKMLENTEVYICTVCGFVYLGDDAPKLCPVCKVPEWKFEKIERRN
ncbi:MAG: rubredoxin [Erysipelotrichaceae bacterium]